MLTLLPQQNDFKQLKDVVCNSNSNTNLSDSEIPLNQTFNGQVCTGYFVSTDNVIIEDFSDCFIFKLGKLGKIFVNLTTTLDRELDNVPDLRSNSMQLDLLDFSTQDCPKSNLIDRCFDSSNKNSFQIQKK